MCRKGDCTFVMRSTLASVVQITFMIQVVINGVYGAERFLVSRTTGPWPTAETSCRSARSRLALVDTQERMRAFERDTVIGPGVPVWVDRFVGFTSIVTIEGCYTNSSLLYDKITVMEDNTLVRCLTQCKDNLYIAMQGPICYCMDSVPPRVAPVLGMQCRSMCPGDTGRFSAPPVSQCGNLDSRTNTVSLYRKVRPGEINRDRNLPNEGECISYNIRSRLWQPDNCTSPRLFVCDQKPCLQSPVNCMIEAAVTVPWVTARTRCEGSRMTLATVNFTTDDYFFNKGQAQFPLYWTGLHRQEVTIWGNDISAKDVQRSDKCVAMVKGPDGQWIWFLDWCIREHRYVCLENNTDTTTVTQSTPRLQTSRQTAAPTTSRTTKTTTTTTTDNRPTLNPNSLPVNVTSSASSILTSVISTPFLLLIVSPLTLLTVLF